MMFHCFFEQSGTFKKEFQNLGYCAADYDISNTYGQTDFICDLFREIRCAFNGLDSIFDHISSEDMIIAFFPCTRFNCMTQLDFRCDKEVHKSWTDIQKCLYDIKLHDELHQFYTDLNMLAVVCLDRDLKLVIENPYTQPNYLSAYWALKPAVIDYSSYKKPTQYWFINCEPKENFIFEPQIIRPIRNIASAASIGNRSREEVRSEITPEYANRFIREFLI